MLLHLGRVFAYDLHGKCWERRSAPGASTTAIRALDAAVTAVNGGVRWLTAGRGGGEMIPVKPSGKGSLYK